MLGLVLWCDGGARHALIWCEDHGDLAWYDGRTGTDPVMLLHAGDLVHVVIGHEPGLRRARTLRVVTRGVQGDMSQLLSRPAAG